MRESSIMLMSACGRLTLLDSSAPETSFTSADAGAVPPDFRRSRPSSPLTS